ncbi:hypothetical protein T4C_13750 [Trichinella pseudospiralis]|uniref:Uncharacterized protein n=1 Tax=Trichinella pseudospiralis TaxID=6337 RepID=A0A0V1H108_TRIPS|nr:hypothetical protein T4C_13004 [Trichinella pseudospiralis]KRZ03834.1 hypothetical protein T4C_13750 [Trichinella pseudospiralis]
MAAEIGMTSMFMQWETFPGVGSSLPSLLLIHLLNDTNFAAN